MKLSEMIKKLNILIGAFLCMFLISCTNDGLVTSVIPDDSDITETSSVFVYSDTCIVTSMSKNSESITFQNLETGLRYTLTYDNLTYFTDRYGNSMTGSQLSAGQICNITFYREEKRLKTLDVSSDYFAYSNVEGFKFYNSATRMEYLGDKYELDENVVVCSGKENINVLEISDSDIITIHGSDHKIYSITVDKGHGYLSLSGCDYFIDGFIEIDKDIRKITEGMMLTVPEGRYSVLISKDGTSAVKEVTVGRNQDAVIDLSDVEIKKYYGNVNFTTEPSNATIFLDGVKVNDFSKPVSIEYGIHELVVRADGYETLSRFISVGSPEADVSFKLTKLSDDTDKVEDKDKDSSTNTNSNTSSSNSSNNSNTSDNSNNSTNNNNTSNNTNTASSNNTSDNTNTASGNNTQTDQTSSTGTAPENKSDITYSTFVYIDAPDGADLYLDGNLIGVVPTSFKKTVGTIVITLKKEGYQTRSYTINFEDVTTDSHYSFSELLKLD